MKSVRFSPKREVKRRENYGNMRLAVIDYELNDLR